MTETAMPASPCVKVCRINPSNGLCCGCLRTADEIAAWPAATPDAQRAILGRVALRRVRLALHGSAACDECRDPCSRRAASGAGAPAGQSRGDGPA